jgi:hypothetical protein
MKKSELKKYIKEIILAELHIKAKSVSESEKEPTEDEIKKEKSLVKAQTEFTKITKELKANIGKSKAIVAKKPTERTKEEKKFLDKMEKLTQRKKQLKTDFRNLEDED